MVEKSWAIVLVSRDVLLFSKLILQSSTVAAVPQSEF